MSLLLSFHIIEHGWRWLTVFSIVLVGGFLTCGAPECTWPGTANASGVLFVGLVWSKVQNTLKQDQHTFSSVRQPILTHKMSIITYHCQAVWTTLPTINNHSTPSATGKHQPLLINQHPGLDTCSSPASVGGAAKHALRHSQQLQQQ